MRATTFTKSNIARPSTAANARSHKPAPPTALARGPPNCSSWDRRGAPLQGQDQRNGAQAAPTHGRQPSLVSFIPYPRTSAAAHTALIVRKGHDGEIPTSCRHLRADVSVKASIATGFVISSLQNINGLLVHAIRNEPSSAHCHRTKGSNDVAVCPCVCVSVCRCNQT